MFDQSVLLETVQTIPPEWATLLLAALPVTELRAALPIALTVFDLPVVTAVAYSLLGNLLPLVLVFLLLPPVLRFSEKHWKGLHHVMEKHIRALEKKHADRYVKYGSAVLFLFVAIPLPGTGVWTASVLAVVFGIKPKHSLPMIVGGLFVASMIVLFLTQGGVAAVGL